MEQIQQAMLQQTQAFAQAMQQQQEATQRLFEQQSQAQAAQQAQVQSIVQAQQAQVAELQQQMQNMVLAQQAQSSEVQQGMVQVAQAMTSVMQTQRRPGMTGGDAPGAAPTLNSGDLEEVKSIIHPGLLERVEKHDGQEASFPSWRFQFESLAALIGLDRELDSALKESDAGLELAVIDPDAAVKAKALWYLLVRTQSARGTNVLQLTEKYNGFLGWKCLVREFQPVTGGRFNAMLTALLHPDWSKGDFDLNKAAWEKMIIQYETQSGERFTSSMRIATICKYAPSHLTEAVKIAAMTSLEDYPKFSVAMKSALQATKVYTFDGGGVAPMRVGGIDGKAAGKGLPCDICGKPGHRGKDCWYKKGAKGACDKTDIKNFAASAMSRRLCRSMDRWTCGKRSYTYLNCCFVLFWKM